METVGARMERYAGFGPGFDMLRLLLASGVVLWHSFPLTTGSPHLIEGTPFWFLVSAMVPMFFALSGFLVTASAARTKVVPFLLNRGARIFPALISVVLFAALILGPIFTTLPLAEYFRAPELYRYLMGLVGLVGFSLPGVWENLPTPNNVNGSLWTVPHELLCYAIVAAFMVAGLLRRVGFMIGFFALIFVLAIFAEMDSRPAFLAPLGFLLDSVHFAQGSKIIPFFVFGSILYTAQKRIPYSNLLGILSLAVILLVGAFVEPSARKGPLLWLATAPMLTYIVVWIGLKSLAMPKFLEGKDLSYGVYLWHFPILQILVWSLGITVWWQLFALSILPVGLVAWVSWHRIEKPALVLRKSLRFSAGRS
jgi:peptidoglycan/LPS O-acetylase OafA/YrhL